MKSTTRPSLALISVEHGLEPLLELAAVLRPGEQRADVERPHAPVLEALGHVAGDDALREPLGDRGLPHSGLADQHRVVLRPAREDLDHAADLLVAADHRVELAGLSGLGQVAAELLERLVAPLRILGGHALPAAHLLDPGKDLVARDRLEREEQVLGRDEVVLETCLLALGVVEAPSRASSKHAAERWPRRSRPAGRRASAPPRRVAPASRRRAPGRAARAAGAPDRSPGSRAGAHSPAPPQPLPVP